ncbi:OLC1v1024815C1 [Oldenlandia corymbosa var. corymbosa]|uniref:OLC1v1024815C1 n=1 Tax=Oldenlandia corymbosa var. corymbosa TaxID=529605 RepID=A0AAV1C3M1_OLDCO|nr:OLC1v1024815C1 [Oldenlandia corymbosa var. corymbosa]
MGSRIILFAIFSVLAIASSSSVNAATAKSPISSPAPAPAPEYVNLTHLFSFAGPYKIFLGYLESTKVLDTFQNQANDTTEGITIFAPNDAAFSKLKNPSLANLTQDQLRSVCLYHALAHYYTLADFQKLSQSGPVTTFAGGQYSLNFTDNSGTVLIDSGWSKTKISSSVSATDRAAVYEVNKVLLPEAIFGTDIPPTSAPAPAPTPETAPTADSPAADGGSKSAPASSTKPSSSFKISSLSALTHLVFAVAIGGFLFL